ncbi:MAG: ComEC/Rec2 family competence protein [Alphaproteobacteria bacterium]|nr:ComEC/Rec2 family competence protein [Alphaproteobacteria bacterium]
MKLSFMPNYQDRFLWYFFAFAMGCAIYFGIDFEPWCLALVIASGILGFFLFKTQKIFIGICFFACLGLTVASVRTHLVSTSMLSQPLWRQTLSGFVTDHVISGDKQILTLNRVWAKNKKVPKQVRLSLYAAEPILHVGDWVKLQAHLFPPETFMTQRMFFQGTGASGKVLRVFQVRPKSTSKIDKMRDFIITRIKSVLPATTAQIAIPLVTGEQRVVTQQQYEIYRKAGIAHILSVSGFHMALLAGFIFFLIRGLLCCFPCIALRIDTKKIAALIALGVTFFYLLLSGIQIPALRAFLMIGISLVAILLERRAISLYTLLVVGFLILFVRPEWIMSISFQLSFVAMMVLVSLFEQVNTHLKSHKVIHWIWALIGANILVELLLIPYVIYHFNQINLYGVVGNLAVSLLFSFCVMPLLFIGCLFMPFGWDAAFLQTAGWFLEHINNICVWIGQLPYSEILVSSFHGMGLWIISLGIGILCLSKTKFRFSGCTFILLGFCIGYGIIKQPDLFIANGGKTILVRGEDNLLYTHQKNLNLWLVKRKLKENGQKDALLLTTDSLITLKDHKIALTNKACAGADFAILPKKKKCNILNQLQPNKHINYEVFIEKDILVQQENAAVQSRLWFNQGGHQ